MILFSFGEMLFVPLSTSLVSGMSTLEERGRYMGAWSLVWIGGQALSPLYAGWGMDVLGGRAAFLVVLAAGLAGAALYPLLCRGVRERERPAAGVTARRSQRVVFLKVAYRSSALCRSRACSSSMMRMSSRARRRPYSCSISA